MASLIASLGIPAVLEYSHADLSTHVNRWISIVSPTAPVLGKRVAAEPI